MHQTRSIPYSKFKSSLEEISKIMWIGKFYQNIALHSMNNLHGKLSPEMIVGSRLNNSQLSMELDQIRKATPILIERQMALYTVGVFGMLEIYLKSISTIHCLKDTRLRTEKYCFNAIGKQLMEPILGKDSVVGPLIFLSELLGITISDEVSEIKKFYKIRSAIAHNFGPLGVKSSKNLSSEGHRYNSIVNVSFSEFKRLLQLTHQLATKLDKHVMDYDATVIDIVIESRNYFDDKLPRTKHAKIFEHAMKYGITSLRQWQKVKTIKILFDKPISLE